MSVLVSDPSIPYRLVCIVATGRTNRSFTSEVSAPPIRILKSACMFCELRAWALCNEHPLAGVILRSMHAADNPAMIGNREDTPDRSRGIKSTNKKKKPRRSGRSTGSRAMAADGLISKKEFPLFMEYVIPHSSQERLPAVDHRSPN